MLTHERHHKKEQCKTCGDAGTIGPTSGLMPDCPDCENLCSHGTEIDHEHCEECSMEKVDSALDEERCKV